MSASIRVDVDGKFKRALIKLGQRHKMTQAQIVNQNLLDIAEKSFEFAPYPKGVTALPPAPQQAIRNEIRQVVADRKLGATAQTKEQGIAGRIIKGGKNKGKFQRYRANRQLMAIHLISNYWRGKSGKKGLYGEDMMRYAGSVSKSRTGGAGSLKIAFLPAIRQLMPFAKFKFSWSAKAKGIKRWPGSAGWGSAKPGRPGTKPEAIFTANRTPNKGGRDGYVRGLLVAAVSKAIAWKRAKVIAKAEEMLKPAIAEFNR